MGEFYERVVLRHLEFHRNEESFVHLEKFLEEVNGHSYSFRPRMLIKRGTFKMNRQQMDDKSSTEEQIVEKDRTFFCSELVAKAYKVCGIMEPTD